MRGVTLNHERYATLPVRRDAWPVVPLPARRIALILPHVPLDQLAALLDANFQLDWLSHAFTRCLVDNTLLVAADDAALARAPQDARRHDEPLCHCPACGRVYWRGSHYKRMRAKLNAWQELKCG